MRVLFFSRTLNFFLNTYWYRSCLYSRDWKKKFISQLRTIVCHTKPAEKIPGRHYADTNGDGVVPGPTAADTIIKYRMKRKRISRGARSNQPRRIQRAGDLGFAESRRRCRWTTDRPSRLAVIWTAMKTALDGPKLTISSAVLWGREGGGRGGKKPRGVTPDSLTDDNGERGPSNLIAFAYLDSVDSGI